MARSQILASFVKKIVNEIEKMDNKTPWWYNYREKRYKKRNYMSMEMILRKSFKETLKEYLDTCSVGGIKQIRDPTTPRPFKLCWIVIFCASLSSVSLFLYSTWMTTFTRPLIVSAESYTYPIKDIDFPAIALCNFNRISNKAMTDLSQHIINEAYQHGHRWNTNLSDPKEFVKGYLQELGRLIDYRYDNKILNNFYISPLPFNTSILDLMQKLAPKCEEMLIKCKWAGKYVNCSQIFQMRRTGLGHCCAFNYVFNFTDTKNADSMDAVKRQVVPGANNGLLVIADPLAGDKAYSMSERSGFQVLIYDPRHFPDHRGGRVLYRIAQPNQAEVLQIESIKQYATNEVRKYPRQTRKCLFKTELRNIYKNKYSYSNCLLRCRMEAVQSLCKCVPYFYPTGMYKSPKLCTLANLRCLHKYKEKLLYFYPIDTKNTSGLESELTDSLYCPDCLPDCELTQHFTRNYKISMSKMTSIGLGNGFTDGINLTDKCVLSVYHPTSVGVLHRLDVVAYWFEILSNIGGFAGVMMGIGCFTFVEILYFVIIRFVRTVYLNYKKYH